MAEEADIDQVRMLMMSLIKRYGHTPDLGNLVGLFEKGTTSVTCRSL